MTASNFPFSAPSTAPKMSIEDIMLQEINRQMDCRDASYDTEKAMLRNKPAGYRKAAAIHYGKRIAFNESIQNLREVLRVMKGGK